MFTQAMNLLITEATRKPLCRHAMQPLNSERPPASHRRQRIRAHRSRPGNARLTHVAPGPNSTSEAPTYRIFADTCKLAAGYY